MFYHRGLFGFISRAFNNVDKNRLTAVGADRLCAEWIIKNGGSIRFENMEKIFKDYNTLPNEDTELHVKEIYAFESSITTIGFDHLCNCRNVAKIVLHSCHEIDDGALNRLHFVKNSLTHLEIMNCPYIGDSGLLAVANLSNLKKIILHDLKSVKSMSNVELSLKKKLLNCEFIVSK